MQTFWEIMRSRILCDFSHTNAVLAYQIHLPTTISYDNSWVIYQKGLSAKNFPSFFGAFG